MTYTTPPMIVSGVEYVVTEVQGRPPADLTDFVGVVTFVVEGQTGTHEVAGAGAEHDGAVRFHQKDAQGVGKDIRVWTVKPGPGGRFVAEAA